MCQLLLYLGQEEGSSLLGNGANLIIERSRKSKPAPQKRSSSCTLGLGIPSDFKISLPELESFFRRTRSSEPVYKYNINYVATTLPTLGATDHYCV